MPRARGRAAEGLCEGSDCDPAEDDADQLETAATAEVRRLGNEASGPEPDAAETVRAVSWDVVAGAARKPRTDKAPGAVAFIVPLVRRPFAPVLPSPSRGVEFYGFFNTLKFDAAAIALW